MLNERVLHVDLTFRFPLSYNFQEPMDFFNVLLYNCTPYLTLCFIHKCIYKNKNINKINVTVHYQKGLHALREMNG